jgi:uncharacterized protein (TIGR01777 family)
MRILMSGSHGLIGKALIPQLVMDGHQIIRLVREAVPDDDNIILWDPLKGKIDRKALKGIDIVIHLAGENVASSRWNDEKKRAIYDSRVKGTKVLVSAISKMKVAPRLFLCASSIGYYGDRGDETLDEHKTQGKGFLSQVCHDWEVATKPLKKTKTRLINMRIGVVLTKEGGALKRMLRPFRFGLGGRLGSGKQYFSWITMKDLLSSIHHIMLHDDIEGPINLVAPSPVTNKTFTKTLGTALGMPTVFPLPAFVAKLAFGEMASELLLSGNRVLPQKLLKHEFKFQNPELEGALKSILGEGL